MKKIGREKRKPTVDPTLKLQLLLFSFYKVPCLSFLRRFPSNYREMLELADAISHMDLTDNGRTFHPDTKECIFLSASHKTFSKFVLRLNRYKKKKTEIKSANFATITD